jgi:putative nucleotidyltransferase with HDIG domain
MPDMRTRLFYASQVVLLGAGLSAGILLSRAQDWHPAALVALLLALTVVGQHQTLTVRNQQLSAAFVALVLAMSLLGPAPAAALGLVAMVMTSASRRVPLAVWLNNLSTYAVFPITGGLLIRLLVGDVHDPRNVDSTQSVKFGLIVFGVFAATNILNFFLVAIRSRVLDGRSLARQVRELFIPLLPGQVTAALLAAILAVVYANLGYPALLGLVLVIVIFQHLAIALLRSEDRADQLEARSLHLASLQLGVLTTLVETLALRDRTTARHAAAVARYARELARAVGASEADQDLIHTAGLLHDIGKFALPDRILHAEILSDEDWAVIRRHPQDGATLVGRLDGYGPVAEAILYHHEHVDGSGYPAGLIGNEIPLASRIIAICSTYDTLTARESYRSPMTPQDAMAELRKVAGRQLDSDLVEAFIEMLESAGPAISAAGDEANFETELAFERRARTIAQPARG